MAKVSEIAAKTGGLTTVVRGEEGRFPPSSSRAEVGHFSVFVAESGAGSWKEWFQTFVIQGKNSDADEKTTTIELLNPTLAAAVFRIKLEGVGVVGLAPTNLDAAGSGPRPHRALARAPITFGRPNETREGSDGVRLAVDGKTIYVF